MLELNTLALTGTNHYLGNVTLGDIRASGTAALVVQPLATLNYETVVGESGPLAWLRQGDVPGSNVAVDAIAVCLSTVFKDSLISFSPSWKSGAITSLGIRRRK